MRNFARPVIRAALLAMILLVSGPAAQAEWNVASAPAFTYCHAEIACSGQPLCTESVLGLATDCTAFCQEFPDQPGECFATSSVLAEPGWLVRGYGAAQDGGSFANPPGPDLETTIAAFGSRISDDLFEIDLEFQTNRSVRVELALIRYTGDPSALDGLRVESVSELVVLGFIDESDVLFFQQFDSGVVIDAPEVDVAGIPDEQLVLFSVGTGRTVATPAMGRSGAAAITLLLLSAGSWWLMRRRAARRP